MFVLFGMLVVVVSVVGGFKLEHGNLSLLVNPAEFIIIFGAALGSFIISSQPKVVGLVIKQLLSLIKSKSYTKKHYIELLSLLYEIFNKMKKEGAMYIEADVEEPRNSAIFKKHPGILGDRDILNFICDNLKVMITTNPDPHELESLMEVEIETHFHESMLPAKSISKVADTLPGLGIVAAVLGIILTMGKIDQPPEVIGHSIGSALVGTFLGVLMSYGFVGPLGGKLEHMAAETKSFLETIRVAVVAFARGAAPQRAVEFGRRAVPIKDRPLFNELEQMLRGGA